MIRNGFLDLKSLCEDADYERFSCAPSEWLWCPANGTQLILCFNLSSDNEIHYVEMSDRIILKISVTWVSVVIAN